MRQVISTPRRSPGIAGLIFGYSLAAISMYALYRFGAFIIAQIEIPANIENAGLAAFVITITLAGTNLLLRYDMKPIRKTASVREKEYFH